MIIWHPSETSDIDLSYCELVINVTYYNKATQTDTGTVSQEFFHCNKHVLQCQCNLSFISCDP